MKLKKLIGIVSSVSVMALSMSAVCVYAEGEPALEDWTLTPVYEETFDGLEADTAVDTLKEQGWTFSRNGNDAITVRTDASDNAISVQYNRSASYLHVEDEGSYYYSYKVRGYDEACSVSLSGVENGVLVSGADLFDSSYEFTTVVDPAAKKAYTYNSRKTLVNTTTIGDAENVAGIVFARSLNENVGLYIYDFNYGTASLDTGEPETKTAAFEFDESIEDINNKETIEVTITPNGEEAQTKTGDLQSLMGTHLSGEGNVKFAVVLTNIPESATVNSVTIY